MGEHDIISSRLDFGLAEIAEKTKEQIEPEGNPRLAGRRGIQSLGTVRWRAGSIPTRAPHVP